jgi:hypothetical protein
MNPQDKLDDIANSLPELNLSQPATGYVGSNPLQTNLPENFSPLSDVPAPKPVPSTTGGINPLMQIQQTTKEGVDSNSFTSSPSFISNPKDKKLVTDQYIVEAMKVIEQNGQDPFKQVALIEQIKIRYLQEVHHYTVKQPGARN